MHFIVSLLYTIRGVLDLKKFMSSSCVIQHAKSWKTRYNNIILTTTWRVLFSSMLGDQNETIPSCNIQVTNIKYIQIKVCKHQFVKNTFREPIHLFQQILQQIEMSSGLRVEFSNISEVMYHQFGRNHNLVLIRFQAINYGVILPLYIYLIQMCTVNYINNDCKILLNTNSKYDCMAFV